MQLKKIAKNWDRIRGSFWLTEHFLGKNTQNLPNEKAIWQHWLTRSLVTADIWKAISLVLLHNISLFLRTQLLFNLSLTQNLWYLTHA